MKSNFIEELRWRGMLHDITPETEELLQKEMVTGYIGFDPTADSLHVGSLAQIMTLIHFQKAGHKPMALVGGATGMVGDPSGKSQERNLLDETTLTKNVAGIKSQLERFLDFNCGETSATIVNNFDWFKNYNFLEFIRDIGKHITVNYMMSKDSVKNRLENGMSFTEFSYQLVQGYDFYYLYKNQGVKLQMGGSDQWGNIVTGTELIRRKDSGDAHAITTELIKKADGTKFGKSEGGNIWLDKDKTSPYKFYQFWLGSSDADADKYIRIFTLLEREEIEKLLEEHNKAKNLYSLQKALAREVTIRTHGIEEFNLVIEATEKLFKTTGEEFKQLPLETLNVIASGVDAFTISKSDLANGINIVDLLAVNTAIYSSKTEAKKAIQGNAVAFNKTKIADINAIIDSSLLINDKYILAQKGKTNFCMIIVE